MPVRPPHVISQRMVDRIGRQRQILLKMTQCQFALQMSSIKWWSIVLADRLCWRWPNARSPSWCHQPKADRFDQCVLCSGNRKYYWIFEEKNKWNIRPPNVPIHSVLVIRIYCLLAIFRNNNYAWKHTKNGKILTSATEILAWTTSATCASWAPFQEWYT